MRAPRAALPLVAAVVALSALPAAALAPPVWDTTRDGGQLLADRAKFVVASPRLDRVNQGLDTVVVAGDANANRGGVDRDITVTAYNAQTGAVRWVTPPEIADIGADSTLAGFHINEHNNNLYEVVNRGGNILYRERGVSNGALGSGSYTIPGATALASATSTGSFIGIVGKQGDNGLVSVIQSGLPTHEFTATPTAGELTAADMPEEAAGAPIDFARTLLVTGKQAGFGNLGDVYTAAYNYRSHTKLWEATWSSDGNALDAGVVAETGWIDALPAGSRDVGFVVGKSFSTPTGFDIVVMAYDLSSGTPLWSGVQRFNGTSSKDDLPIAAHFSRATGVLYVTGTSNRAPTTDQEIAVLAFDGATGTLLHEAYQGGVVNADDVPTDIVVTPDGSKVLVSGDLVYSTAAAGRQSALLAFDRNLTPIGSAQVGASGTDYSAGIALSSTSTRVFLGGASPGPVDGLDHRATAFEVEDLDERPDPVVPEAPLSVLLPLLALAGAAAVIARRRSAAATA